MGITEEIKNKLKEKELKESYETKMEEVMNDVVSSQGDKKYKCENCEEQEVEHKGDWCDDCNLPERSWIK